MSSRYAANETDSRRCYDRAPKLEFARQTPQIVWRSCRKLTQPRLLAGSGSPGNRLHASRIRSEAASSGGGRYDPERSQFDHVEDGRRWSVRLSDPRDRVIGSLRVPRVDVEFVFQRYDLADINAFMTRFHAHFRRGGG
jgi:hypothetical protein